MVGNRRAGRATAAVEPKRAFLVGHGTDEKRQERPSLKQAANASVRPKTDLGSNVHGLIVVTASSASGLGSFQRFMNRSRQVADLVGLA